MLLNEDENEDENEEDEFDEDYDATYGAALVLIMAKQMRQIVQETHDDQVTIMTQLLGSWADSLLEAVLCIGIPAKEVVRTAEKLDTHVKARLLLDEAFGDDDDVFKLEE
jgi:hypothetical protein